MISVKCTPRVIKYKFVVYLFCILCGLSLLAYCQKSVPDVPEFSVFQFLRTEGALDISINSSFDTLLENKEIERYQPAVLSYGREKDQVEKMDIQISTRGNSRKSYCRFPPLRLNFKNAKLEEEGQGLYKTLKLVIPCKEDQMYKEFVLKEYLCYKLYQIVASNYFQVQLADLTLVEETKDTVLKGYSFLIENENEMADRLKGRIIDDAQSNETPIDNRAYNILALFQFMIGNTDWNINRMHNIKLVDRDDEIYHIPIPYDFDNSGLVNAGYARPHPNLAIDNVRERLFQWRGKRNEDILIALKVFLGAKRLILQTISSFDMLPIAVREEMLDYLHEFYDMVEQEDPVSSLLE